MIAIIDNYDSFTFNLVQRLGEIDSSLDIKVFRNDQISVEQLRSRNPSHLIISPGPCTPDKAGISIECVNQLMHEIPLLGVCLGHQSIGQATGGSIVAANKLMHGKTDKIYHNGQGIFAGIPNPTIATRYHSLAIQPSTLSENFEVTAWTNEPGGEQEIMGIQHRTLPVVGVQFHPESFLTEHGHEMLRHFLCLAKT